MEIKFKHTCDKCENDKILNEKYDSYYCGICDEWLESNPALESEFGGRPIKPSQLTEREKKPIWK